MMSSLKMMRRETERIWGKIEELALMQERLGEEMLRCWKMQYIDRVRKLEANYTSLYRESVDRHRENERLRSENKQLSILLKQREMKRKKEKEEKEESIFSSQSQHHIISEQLKQSVVSLFRSLLDLKQSSMGIGSTLEDLHSSSICTFQQIMCAIKVSHHLIITSSHHLIITIITSSKS